MIQEKLKKSLPIFAAITFVTVLFFPSISLGSSLPKIDFIDFVLPFVAVYVFLRRKELVHRKAIYILLGFSAYILITMAINGRLGQMRDYFEIFKLIKIALIIALFSFAGALEFMKKMIKPVFIGLVVINLVHYFNLFHINDFLDELFRGGGRYSVFGLDSAGHQTTKRMIGLLGNPNDNAIMFMIFAIFFFPRKGARTPDFVWFSVALLMMFLCQSRTAFIAIVPMLIAQAIMNRREFKITGITLGLTVICFFLASFTVKNTVHIGVPSKYTVYEDEADSTKTEADLSYIEGVMDGSIAQSRSVQGRLEIWQHLWTMIKKKPIFGHAPYKEYFYENELYAESEYVLIIWRYGFIGLIIYLLWLLVLFRQSIKDWRNEYGNRLLLMVILFSVTCLTNVPFGNKTILVLLAVIIGLYYSELQSKNLTDTNSDEEG